MNRRTLTDAQISSALRAHLPKRAYPGLRERILDAAEATPQQRALPSFLGGLGAADPTNRWRTLLIAAVLLVALALVSAAAVGALRQLLRDPVPNLTLGPTPSPASDRPTPSPVTRATGVPTGVWIATGITGAPRDGYTAVRLLDGRVLIAGGWGAGSEPDVTSAELYHPDSGTWFSTKSMLRPHGCCGFPATLLRDGKVLVGDVDDPTVPDSIPRAEVYDPTTER